MLKRIYNDHPNEKKIDEVVQCLRNGGVIIYPTDTVYGLGCDLNNKKALERVLKLFYCLNHSPNHKRYQ